MDIQYGQLESLRYLWFVGIVAMVAGVALSLHRRAIRQFATPELLRRMAPNSNLLKRLLSGVLTLLALTAMVLALVDVRWGKRWQEVPQKGIEVIFLLDVSRSMLAEDSAPNRLGRAKQDIKDMVAQMSGDRVGLVLFAGGVRRHVPLTSHYDEFKQSLDEVGPHNIDRGGSNLGEAISVATDSFLEKTANHKAIVLITDGEDHESKPIEAAKKAHAEQGVRIYTVGLGDLQRGARIPVQMQGRANSFLEHDGEQIWSKLNGEVLRQIASETDGAYIPAGTKRVDMGAVYHRFIAKIEQRDFNTAKINAYIPRYQWFVGAALMMLVFDVLISTWRRQRPSHETTRAFATMPGTQVGTSAS